MTRITLTDFLTNYIPQDGELGTEAVFQRSLELLKNETDYNGIIVDILLEKPAPAWDAGVTYTTNDIVSHLDFNFIAAAGSLNSEPTIDGTNTDWQILTLSASGGGSGEIIRQDYIAGAAQTDFISSTTLTTPGVFVEGVLVDSSDYTVVNNTIIRFNIAVTEGAEVSVFSAMPTSTELMKSERFVATAAQTVFTTSFEVTTAAIYVNGSLQDSNYTLSANTVTFDEGLIEGDVVVIYTAVPILQSVIGPVETDFDVAAGQTIFTVGYTVGSVQVFLNGIKLRGSEFEATTGSNVTVPSAVEGDWVQVVAYAA